MTFQREDRYIVIKRKDLKKVPINYRSHLVDPMFSLLGHLPRRECLVIESDWPEYEPAWAMIEARMSGAPQANPGVAIHPNDQDEAYRLHRAFIAVDEPNNEQVMAFQDASYVLGLKRGQAHEAALQQRLTETDQRLDELISAVRSLNRGKVHEIRLGSDDQPVYWQRKEWIDWVLELCDQASSRQLTKDSPEVES